MRHRRSVLVAFAAVLVAVAFTIGCGSSSSNQSRIRLVNASPDQSGLDMVIDDKTVASSVGYGAASSYTSITAASHTVVVEPTNTSSQIIDTTITTSSGSSVTLICANYSYNATSVLLSDDNTKPDSGNFKLRIVNVSPGMGPEDVYIIAAGTDINSANPVFSNLGFGSASSYVQLSAGNYDVVFTPPGSKFINLDSGSLTLSAGQIRTLLALNNPVGSYESTMLTDLN